jgi:hypothetical protein
MLFMSGPPSESRAIFLKSWLYRAVHVGKVGAKRDLLAALAFTEAQASEKVAKVNAPMKCPRSRIRVSIP